MLANAAAAAESWSVTEEREREKECVGMWRRLGDGHDPYPFSPVLCQGMCGEEEEEDLILSERLPVRDGHWVLRIFSANSTDVSGNAKILLNKF